MSVFLLLDFNEIGILLTDFRKILNYHFSWKSVALEPGCSTRKDIQTDRHVVVVRNFAKSAWKRLKNNLVSASTMKAYTGMKVQLPSFITSAVNRYGWSASCSDHFTPGKEHRGPLKMWLDGLAKSIWTVWKEKQKEKISSYSKIVIWNVEKYFEKYGGEQKLRA